MTISLHLLDETDPAILWCRLDRRRAPQPCYLQLDLVSAVLRAGTDTSREARLPPRVRAGLVVRWLIPPLTSSAANALVQRARSLAECVVSGSRIVRSGWARAHAGRRAVLDATVQDARKRIESLIADLDPAEYPQVEEHEPDERIARYARTAITAASTDEGLEALARKLPAQVRPRVSGNHVVLWPSPTPLLVELRDRAREERSTAHATGRGRRELEPTQDGCRWLTDLDVLEVLWANAADVPLATATIVELCEIAYPSAWGRSHHYVAELLRKLTDAGAATSVRGSGAVRMGVSRPHGNWRYWRPLAPGRAAEHNEERETM